MLPSSQPSNPQRAVKPAVDTSKLADSEYKKLLMETADEERALELASLTGRTEIPYDDLQPVLKEVAELKNRRVAEQFAQHARTESLPLERRESSLFNAIAADKDVGLKLAWDLVKNPGAQRAIQETAAWGILEAGNNDQLRSLRRFLMSELKANPESWHVSAISSMFSRHGSVLRKTDLGIVVRNHLGIAEHHHRGQLLTLAARHQIKGLAPFLRRTIAAEIKAGEVDPELCQIFLKHLPAKADMAALRVVESLRDGSAADYVEKIRATVALYDRGVPGSFAAAERIFNELPALLSASALIANEDSMITSLVGVFRRESRELPPKKCEEILKTLHTAYLISPRYLDSQAFDLIKNLAEATHKFSGKFPPALNQLILAADTPECVRAGLILALPETGIDSRVAKRIERLARVNNRHPIYNWAETAAACLKLGEIRGNLTDDQRTWLRSSPKFEQGEAIAKRWVASRAPLTPEDAAVIFKEFKPKCSQVPEMIRERLLKSGTAEAFEFLHNYAVTAQSFYDRQAMLGKLSLGGFEPSTIALRKERRIFAPAAIEALYYSPGTRATRILFSSMCGRTKLKAMAGRMVSHFLGDLIDSPEKVRQFSRRLETAARRYAGRTVAEPMRRYADALKRASEFGIENPLRANPELLPVLIANREKIRAIPKDTPVVLFIGGRADYNGAGNGPSLDAVMRRYERAGARVIYAEVGSQQELIQVKDWFLEARGGVPARTVILFGHGNGRELNLGDMRKSVDSDSPGGKPEHYLNADSLPLLLQGGFGGVLAPGGELLTICCEAGAGGRRNRNSFLQGMRTLFPQARENGIFGMSGSGWVRGVHLRRDLSIRRVLYETKDFKFDKQLPTTRV